MWPIKSALVPYLAAFLAVVLGVAVYGSYRTGYKVGRADGDRQVKAMLDAGAAVVRKHDEAIKPTLEKYRADLLALAGRKPRSVYRDSPGCVPEAASGTDGAGSSVSDRRDYGPELRAARDALIRYNALIKVTEQ